MRISTFTTVLPAIALFTCVPLAGRSQEAPAANSSRKPVLVELFTSEGCSSCPPADVILQKLEAQQPVSGAEIIPIEEHVDYWNHDGWVDPYSSPEWTKRQQVYAYLDKKDPYTPEIVVDGQNQFVGNNPKEAVLAIQDATHVAKADVTVTPSSVDAKNARFKVSVAKLPAGKNGDVAEIWLAVTEDGLHSSVSRGENAGHELTHTATLRSLHKIGVADPNGSEFAFNGETAVKLNSHWNSDKLRVTVFVQERKGRQVIGAASVRVKS